MIEEIKKLIKINQQFRLLKMIDKEVNRYNKLRAKLNMQAELIDDFIQMYNEIYDGDLCVIDLEDE